jgi:hypothetical protein
MSILSCVGEHGGFDHLAFRKLAETIVSKTLNYCCRLLGVDGSIVLNRLFVVAEGSILNAKKMR